MLRTFYEIFFFFLIITAAHKTAAAATKTAAVTAITFVPVFAFSETAYVAKLSVSNVTVPVFSLYDDSTFSFPPSVSLYTSTSFLFLTSFS